MTFKIETKKIVDNSTKHKNFEPEHFEVPSDVAKLSDSFACSAGKKEVGQHHFGQLTGRQMSQAKSAKLLLLQELNYEEVTVGEPRLRPRPRHQIHNSSF